MLGALAGCLGEPPLESLVAAATEVLGKKADPAALRARSRPAITPWRRHGRPEALVRARAGRRRRSRRGVQPPYRRLAHRPSAGGRLAACVDCLLCWLYCPDSAVGLDGRAFAGIDLDACKGCELCAAVCPTGAIAMVPMTTETARRTAADRRRGVVEAMRQIDPDVVPVYPITPQTPIIQRFAKAIADGRATGEMIDVESEHSAMSAAIAAAWPALGR